MSNPRRGVKPIPTGLSAQNIVTIKRADQLLEIEEDQKGIPDRVRNVIANLRTVEELHAFAVKAMQEYRNGNLSERTVKRCKKWVGDRLEELRPRTPPVIH